MARKFKYSEIATADLYVDAIYCSPRPQRRGKANDVLTVMLHNCRNQGGFRIPHRADKSIPYIGLYMSGYEPTWPDSLDTDTGILVYFGDNRKGGREIEDTDIGGNRELHRMFDNLAEGGDALEDIPPILVFQKAEEGWDVIFRGLAVPGVKNVHADEFFSTVWRKKDGERFPNYKAKFTILDLGGECVSREWIEALMSNSPQKYSLAPTAWRAFLNNGLNGIEPLAAPSEIIYPGKAAMLPSDPEGMAMLKIIHEKYGKKDPTGFEKLAIKLMYMMDPNYSNIIKTRPTADGGRDAIAEYQISVPTSNINSKVIVECAMEAKCYDPEGKGVGVEQTSRLISRIRNRQFGILITTSYIAQQAYEEIKEDKQPILLCTGGDIVRLLKEKENLNSNNLGEWLDEKIT